MKEEVGPVAFGDPHAAADGAGAGTVGVEHAEHVAVDALIQLVDLLGHRGVAASLFLGGGVAAHLGLLQALRRVEATRIC